MSQPMKPNVIPAIALASGLAIGGPALAAGCLTPAQVESWNNLDAHSIVVRATGGHRYRLDLGGTCIGLKNAISLKVSSRGTGLCVATGDYISYRYHGFGEQRCLISSVEPYTPDERQSSGD